MRVYCGRSYKNEDTGHIVKLLSYDPVRQTVVIQRGGKKKTIPLERLVEFYRLFGGAVKE